MAAAGEVQSNGWRRGMRAGALLAIATLGLAGVGLLGLWGGHWFTTVRNDCRVAALMFHSVVPDSQAPSRYTMRESDFAAQMRELQGRRVKFIGLSELLGYMESARGPAAEPCPYPDGAVLVTFDMDGASYHVQTVLDTLINADIPALFFVPTGFIDQGRAVSANDIRTLAGHGFEFGSHTQWHRDMRRVEPDELQESLQRSRKTLEGLTDQDVRSIAAPGGRYDSDVIELVRAVGFSAFFDSDPCLMTDGRSAFEICRVEVRGDRGMRALHAVTSPARVAAQATLWELKRGLERLIGDRGWQLLHRIRSLL